MIAIKKPILTVFLILYSSLLLAQNQPNTSESPKNFLHGWSASNEKNNATAFNCYSSYGETPFLRGTEFSFRNTTTESSNSACNVWRQISYEIATQKFKNVKLKEGQYFAGAQRVHKIGNTTFDGTPVEHLVFKSKNGAMYGWYILNHNGWFSEGTFGTPSSDLPKVGIGKYSGFVGFNQNSFINNVTFAIVDYKNETIEIRAQVDDDSVGNMRSIKTKKPSRYNSKTGYFLADVIEITATGPSGHVLKTEGSLVGYLGGKHGEIIHGIIYTSPSVLHGVDFILGERN